jgi:CheY-like chemotaxis protein
MGNKHSHSKKKLKAPQKIRELNNDRSPTDFKANFTNSNGENKKLSYNEIDFIPKTRNHLIIDDAQYNRLILSKYLSKFNIISDEASNGGEIMGKNVDIYDIIWMDIRMPIMDGFECTIKLRENNYKGIIIGVTGDVSPETIKRCYDIGMNYVILKPIIFQDFVNLYYIKKYIDNN